MEEREEKEEERANIRREGGWRQGKHNEVMGGKEEADETEEEMKSSYKWMTQQEWHNNVV